jgi:AraC-like DNA-binding protein
MQWFEHMSILGAVQGILLAILLFFRKKNRPTNRYWAVFVLLLSISLTEDFYRPYLPEPALSAIGGLVFLYGPLVFFYVKALLGDPLEKPFLVRHCAIPGVYWTLLGISVALGWGDDEWVELVVANVFFLQLFWYSFKTLQRVWQLNPPENEAVNPTLLRWLRVLIGLLVSIYTLAFVATYLLVFNVPQADWLLRTIQTGCVVVVYAMSYWALVQPDLETSRREIAQEVVKYQNSPLTLVEKQQFLAQITAQLVGQKLYLQPDLTLDKLAKELGINRFYVSQVINEQLGKNFSDLINSYRVTEAKRLLTDPAKSHYSIVGVGFEAGFNSKTAFNTTFKKVTGQSPTDYRKSTKPGVPFEQTEH